MTKWLLKSSYRRMLPMELRKFFFNWVLLRNVFCAVREQHSQIHRDACVPQISAFSVLVPGHTDVLPASYSPAVLAGLLNSSVCQALLCTGSTRQPWASDLKERTGWSGKGVRPVGKELQQELLCFYFEEGTTEWVKWRVGYNRAHRRAWEEMLLSLVPGVCVPEVLALKNVLGYWW